MNSSPKFKLFLMMVLQFFIWGAWLPPLFHLMGAKEGLNFDASQQALIGSCFAIASVLGIFFSNQFADRSFSAERFLAFSHLVGGLAMIGLFFAKSFWPFFALLLVHSLFYVPTISVGNSLAFANLKDPAKEFGLIRMGGTIGWILASWPLYFLLQGKDGAALANAESYAFIVSGVASLTLALYSLTLPHTPPKPAAANTDALAWREAMKLLRLPFLFVLFIVTFIDATIHNGYFVMAFGFLADVGIKPENIMPVMSIGQIAEILTMGVLGMVLSRLGWRTTMIVGILGHAARYAVFAFFPQNAPVIIAVQVLHGICYAFFFATVYIFIDAAFPKDVRASAQGLFNLLILGLGDLAAKWLFVPLMKNWTVMVGTGDGAKEMIDYHKLFLVPSAMALVAVILLAVAFHPPKAIAVDAPAPDLEADPAPVAS
ncbi:MAG: yegT [Chthoniobacteraceae bacterium]|nr:yegT [Chthoniobacteraceae bacterium]